MGCEHLQIKIRRSHECERGTQECVRYGQEWVGRL
jgi:hypothetical protein